MIASPGLNINFLKKENYSGSHSGMRYYLISSDNMIKACVYPEPWCFEKTPEENKIWAEFEFSEDGLKKALGWIDNMYTEQPERWR